jgi:ParB-like chromosome segregation protein Spo0J
MSHDQKKQGRKARVLGTVDDDFRFARIVQPQTACYRVVRRAVRAEAVLSARQIENVKLTEIEINESWRPRGGAEIELLMDSFQTVGQRLPISVSKEPGGLFRIIDGWDRYEAAVLLEMPTVLAEVIKGPSHEIPLIRLAQNHHRKSYDVLKRAEADAEWIEAFRRRVTQVADPLGGRQPSDKCYSKAFAATGIGADRWRRSELIASIPEASKQLIRDLGLHDNQSALLEIANTELSGQLEKIHSLTQPQESRPKPSSGRAISVPTVSATDTNPAENSPPAEQLPLAERESYILAPTAEAPPVATLSIQAVLPSDDAPRCAASVSTSNLIDRADEAEKSLLEPLKPADVETALKKLTAEYLGCSLRELLINPPYKAGQRFISEVLIPDFQRASREALAGPDDGELS